MDWKNALALYLGLFVRVNFYYLIVFVGYLVFERKHYQQGHIGIYMFKGLLDWTYNVFVGKGLMGTLGFYIGFTYYDSVFMAYFLGYFSYTLGYDMLDYLLCKLFRMPYIRPLGRKKAVK